jgi:hypothetical protein
MRFNQSTQARIQTILKGREVPLKKKVQKKKRFQSNFQRNEIQRTET